ADLAQTVITDVLSNGALHVAVGFALGQGVGSLFGENLIGGAVGLVVGAAATSLISVTAFIAQFFVPVLLSAITSVAPAASENDSAPAWAWWVPVTV
ncbi:MAG: hypothetical protein ACKOB8_02170, partial [Mycobacterium sp.]